MWRIDNPTIEKATLDFTSSEQGYCEVSQLKSNGIVLMNALELMEWDDDRTQVLICNHCGFPGCESGNWINIRISGDYVLLIPAFDEMETDDWSRTEYGPPRYLRKQGTPYFDLGTYRSLAELDFGFPEVNGIKKLEVCEAMRLAQFEMPFRIFGEPPTVELRKEKLDLVVAASDGEPGALLEIVEDILNTNYENHEPAQLRAPLNEEEIIYLFLDAAQFTDWQALVRGQRGYKLMLEETLVIEGHSKE